LPGVAAVWSHSATIVDTSHKNLLIVENNWGFKPE